MTTAEKHVQRTSIRVSHGRTVPQHIISWIEIFPLVACALGVWHPVALRARTSTPVPLARGECKMEPDWDVATGNSTKMPSELLGVGISQRLNHAIPLALTFRNSADRSVRLTDYFGKRPVILSPVYFNCPMLCPLEEQALLQAMKQMRFTAGKQFDVLTVSFDPHDTPQIAMQKRRLYLSEYARRAGAQGWYFLTGTEGSITALARSVGFHYRYDAQAHMFAHAVAIVVLTPAGRVAQYFYGIRYPPENLRLALIEASHGKIGSRVEYDRSACVPPDARHSCAIRAW